MTAALAAIGVILPFLGTSLGAGTALLLPRTGSARLRSALLGFAAGVMVAASFFSLLLPAIETAEEAGQLPFLPAVIGFLCGMLFLPLFDLCIFRLRRCTEPSRSMLTFAVTVHNLPEGMAVGAALASAIGASCTIPMSGALLLSFGIAVQNLPEGAIVAMPAVGAGVSRRRAFALGVLSGAVEPLGALLMLAFSAYLSPALPYLLAFAAGAMIYAVEDELVPEAQGGEHGGYATAGFSLGFALMMFLDVALG